MNNEIGRQLLLVLLLVLAVQGNDRVLECSADTSLVFFDVNPTGPKCNRDCETKFSTPAQWNQTFSFFLDDFFFVLVYYLNFNTHVVNKPELASYAQNQIIQLQDKEFNRELEQLRLEYDETLDKEEIETIRQPLMASKTTSASQKNQTRLEELVSLFVVMQTVYDHVKDHYNKTWHIVSSNTPPSYFEQFPNEFSCNKELERSIRVYKILTYMLVGLLALLAIFFGIAYNYFEYRIMQSFTNYKKKS